MTTTITGIHHITAMASDPQRNVDFYTGVLGLRLVKLTVNFDDPGTYHFYFGDAEGSPGTILTFFPWPNARRGAVGNGQVSATSFAVSRASLGFWRARLAEAHVPAEDLGLRFGEPVLRLADPDGLPLELVGTDDESPVRDWGGSDVPAAHAIRGFHSATLAEEDHEPTARLLTDVMGWQFVGREGDRYRYRAPASGGATLVDVLHNPAGAYGQSGAGTVHHIAWRTPDDAEQVQWQRDLVRQGYRVSPVMDRNYFRSIYYREPGGVLFEIATDPPGFAVDEVPEHLGEHLKLPAQYEELRATLAQRLPRLMLPHEQARVRA
jgi:glyoxalase family protein